MTDARLPPSAPFPTGRRPVARWLGGRLARRLGPVFLGAAQRARREQFAATGTPADRIVFLGDSISEFGNWDEWFPQLPVLNRGIGGETSAQVLARLDTAIVAPRLVLLLIGTNDLTAAIPLAEIVANVREILDEIEMRAPGTPVMLQSVMPRTPVYRAEIEALNEQFRALVERRNQNQFLDLWPALAAHDGALRTEFTIDHLHLNGAGYRAWVGQLEPLIELDRR